MIDFRVEGYPCTRLTSTISSPRYLAFKKMLPKPSTQTQPDQISVEKSGAAHQRSFTLLEKIANKSARSLTAFSIDVVALLSVELAMISLVSLLVVTRLTSRVT